MTGPAPERRRLWRWLLTAAVSVAACSPPPAPQSVEDLQPASLGVPSLSALVLGCWAMTWSLDGPIPDAGLELTPDSVLLRGGVVFGSRERILSPATRLPSPGAAEPWESHFRVNRWWTDDDAVVMSFADGTGEEWNVSLSYSGDVLGGEARYSKSGSPADGTRATVRGERIECEGS